MSDMAERIAKMEAWTHGHNDQCKERFQAIRDDTMEIKGTLGGLAVDLKNAVERIHGRLDSGAEERNRINARVDQQKIWNLTGVLTGAAAIIAWLAERLFSVAAK